MKKNYATQKAENHKKARGPSKETIDFLLNYSKALHVSDYKEKSFEMILN